MIKLDEFMERYKTACSFDREINRKDILSNIEIFFLGLCPNRKFSFQFLESEKEVLEATRAARAARAAWDAWDSRAGRAARAAWDAWDSRAARAAWAAWDACDSRATRAAWAAWDSRATRAARAARAAWDAWDSRAARAARDARDASYMTTVIAREIEKNFEDDVEKNLYLFRAFEAGLWSMYWTDSIIYLVELPKISLDAQNRSHNPNGAAFLWKDIKEYFFHGVIVPEYIIERPQEITTQKIESENNAEVRRVMIERYGQSRYLLDSGAKKIHTDDFGTLYRKDIPNDEPLLMVKVVNSTPEPDGSFKDYFLRVDPELRPLLEDGRKGNPQELTAKNAVASTFGKKGNDYAPLIES